MPFRLLAALCLAVLLPHASRAGADARAAAPDPAQVQRMLKLLAGIAGEYREAFDDQGAIVRPIDIDETRLLLGEVNDLTAPLRASDPGFREVIENIGTLVDMRVPPDIIGAYTEVARRIQLMIEYDPQPPFDAGSPEKAGADLVASTLAQFAAAAGGDAAEIFQAPTGPAASR